jgi:hypothetical protein
VTDKWSFLLALGDKVVAIIAFGRGFRVELPQRSSWLSQKTSEILLLDDVIFYMNSSLCEGRVGAGVFSGSLCTCLSCYGFLQFELVLTIVRAQFVYD